MPLTPQTLSLSQLTDQVCKAVGSLHIAHLPQQCHKSKFVIFQEKRLKVLKCYNFL
jgi:hypothetical protein